MSIVRKIADLPRAAVVAAGDQFTIWRNGRTYQADLSLVLAYIGLVAKGDKGDPGVTGPAGDPGPTGQPGPKGDTTANFDVTPLTANGTPTPRLLPSRAADFRNVKDFGAKLDGTDDTQSFNLARGSASNDSVIRVPSGQVILNATPTAGPAGSVLWDLSGNKYGLSSTPVIGIGTDVVESVVEGGKYFGRGGTKPNGTPTVRIDSVLNSVNPGGGGNSQGVINALKVNMVIPPNAASIGNFGWAENVTLVSSAWGDGQHVAASCLATRPADALNDGKGPRSVIWAHYAEANDDTDREVGESGSLVIGEWDMYANGNVTDPAGNQRIGHHIIFSRKNPLGASMRATYGSQLASNDVFNGYPNQADHSFVGVGYGVTLPWDIAAFDASLGLSKGNAPALKMAAGQRIAFDGGLLSGGNRNLYWLNGLLTYSTQNGVVLQIDDGGNLIALGSLKAPFLNVPETTPPTTSSDTRGAIGDVLFSGPNMFRKTTSGWIRFTGASF